MHIVYPVHLPNGYQICVTGMALEGRMEGKSISHPRIAFGEIVHASLKPQVVGKHHFCGAWYGDYGMVSMETKEEEKKSPLRLFIPPRPFSHSHWESGYEGYVIEGKPCSNEEFEMHRMYQYASPFLNSRRTRVASSMIRMSSISSPLKMCARSFHCCNVGGHCLCW